MSAPLLKPADPVMDEFILGQKRRKEELELEERSLLLEQDRHELEVSKRDKALEHTGKAIALIQSFTHMDGRVQLQFENHIKNMILTSGANKTPGISVYACIDQQEQAIGRPSTAPSTTRTHPSTRSRSRATASQSGP